RPRPLGVLAEEMIKALDAVPEPEPPPNFSGSSGGLSLTMSEVGLISCDTDPEWVAAQSAAGLMNALKRALSQARRKLRDSPVSPGRDAESAGLLAEVLSVLVNPGRASP